MADVLFLGITAALLYTLMFWGFRHLPDERWQMLAVLPSRKKDEHFWHGINLTYYGFFLATSQLLSLMLLLVLIGAMSISLPGTLLATAMILAVCLPAARVVAILVEKKRHTFTIGGASFVGILLAPLCIIAAQGMLDGFMVCNLPTIPVMAAMAIAYTLGEGLGRLGCLSFGCCYGKPLKNCPPLMRRVFARHATVFQGRIKKVEYESRLAGEPLVPVQAITCLIYTTTALVGSYLFLRQHCTASLLICIGVTQSWRFFSEILRADYRGEGKITVYQKMGGLAIVYVCAIALLPHGQLASSPAIIKGLTQLWQPAIIVGLQLAWLVFFLYFGRSTVTSATITYALHHERV
jgi:prolipoprotein diacylglyceryltransferase